MERVALLLSMYNYIPPSTPHIIDLIVQQLGLPQHVLKGEQHTTVLFSIVYFLTLLRTFPEELIQMLLSEDYLKTHFGQYQPFSCINLIRTNLKWTFPINLKIQLLLLRGRWTSDTTNCFCWSLCLLGSLFCHKKDCAISFIEFIGYFQIMSIINLCLCQTAIWLVYYIQMNIIHIYIL